MNTPTQFQKNVKTGKASEWTPLEALLHALNLLNDPDRKITRCIVVLGHIDEEDESDTSCVVCTKNAYETSGMMASALRATTDE